MTAPHVGGRSGSPPARPAAGARFDLRTADASLEYCDVHRDFVELDRTRPLAPGSIYRICDACLDERRRR